MTPRPRPLAHVRRLAASLRTNASAVAYLEFALMLPILTILGLGGVEIANLANVSMRISQIVFSVADNASRAKQDVSLGLPQLREADINDLLLGAMRQGEDLRLQQHGRVILSSLETNASGGQWIHWQRCRGAKPWPSSYGTQGQGQTGTALSGMGPAGRQVAAEPGYAIMFVEIAYDYQPVLFPNVIPSRLIRDTAAMYVRDNRDLTQVYNPTPSATVSAC